MKLLQHIPKSTSWFVFLDPKDMVAIRLTCKTTDHVPVFLGFDRNSYYSFQVRALVSSSSISFSCILPEFSIHISNWVSLNVISPYFLLTYTLTWGISSLGPYRLSRFFLPFVHLILPFFLFSNSVSEPFSSLFHPAHYRHHSDN